MSKEKAKKKQYRQIKSIDEVLKLIATKGKIVYWIDEEMEKEAIENINGLYSKFSSVSTCDRENIIVLRKDHNGNDWNQINEIDLYKLYHGIWLVKK